MKINHLICLLLFACGSIGTGSVNDLLNTDYSSAREKVLPEYMVMSNESVDVVSNKFFKYGGRNPLDQDFDELKRSVLNKYSAGLYTYSASGYFIGVVEFDVKNSHKYIFFVEGNDSYSLYFVNSNKKISLPLKELNTYKSFEEFEKKVKESYK